MPPFSKSPLTGSINLPSVRVAKSDGVECTHVGCRHVRCMLVNVRVMSHAGYSPVYSGFIVLSLSDSF